jgi:hypothetical protein
MNQVILCLIVIILETVNLMVMAKTFNGNGLHLATPRRAGSSKLIRNGLLNPAHQKREEDTTDEYSKDQPAVWY